MIKTLALSKRASAIVDLICFILVHSKISFNKFLKTANIAATVKLVGCPEGYGR
ncbi:predicted protein [Sclerotinia sclerotiorum 1980 UF-70]|uniref:Uncharacterized protein n=1 Tax=Sclerotinia sclerotiorum (strain ATCC 18683 / 1980 / Ss-1) TaxID=665079 RepID=A7EDX4_SCLS1|nr:predicted protein [Sclerotinia sclerotiorum 1980 UF-70]EDO01040.1 predicted protein [Sclerotinia sclerotiorum 1980 UF-70]